MKQLHLDTLVKVKLTPYGKEFFRQRARTAALMSGIDPPRNSIEEDAEGYSQWVLQELMWWFGGEVGYGSPLPFESLILVEEGD